MVLAGEVAGPLWILAHEQTAGRGRRGRAWIAPGGNFSATLVMPVSDPPERVALRSFVAALALDEALRALLGPATAGLALKWPNDVLLNGGKLSGILLETISAAGRGGAGRKEESGRPSHLAIGVAVNLLDAPPAEALEAGALRPVCLLGETGLRVAAEDFLDLLAPAFAGWEERLAAYGFEPLRNAWLARAAGLGEAITVRTGRSERRGRFETLDETGALVLNTGNGTCCIAAGEVFF